MPRPRPLKRPRLDRTSDPRPYPAPTAPTPSPRPIDILDLHPPAQNVADLVLAGLRADPPTLPCMLFYDEEGSQLFDQICDLPEYYPTRTERGILQDAAADLADLLGTGVTLVEYGSGSSDKTGILLGALDLAAYVPIDISRWYIETSAKRLAGRWPGLTILPVVADYNQTLRLPEAAPAGNLAAFFPGGTLGNFRPDDAVAFLKRAAGLLGVGGHLIVGFDRKKDPAVLHAAYNDAGGTTAAFNLNLLRRLNRDLDADFDLAYWHHCAPCRFDRGRIEMHLVSGRDQTVTVAGETFTFTQGQGLRTELSHKYSPADADRLFGAAGFETRRTWSDEQGRFAVRLLRVT